MFKTQLAEAHITNANLNYLEIRDNTVRIRTVELWKLGELCHTHYFEKSDQEGHILPVFRVS